MLRSFNKFIQNIDKDSAIVEIGCGDGKNLLILKKLDYLNCEGCDLNLTFVSKCNKIGLNVIYCDILNLQYKDNQFEITLCIEVLHHFESENCIINSLNELVRITKNGGHIYIAVNAYNGVGKQNDYVDYNGIPTFYHYFDQHELTYLCESIKGCKVVFDNCDENHQICILNVIK